MAKEVKEGSARKTGLTPRIAVMFLLHRNRNQCISLEAVLSLAPRGNGSPPRSPRPITTHPRFQSGGVSSAAVDSILAPGTDLKKNLVCCQQEQCNASCFSF